MAGAKKMKPPANLKPREKIDRELTVKDLNKIPRFKSIALDQQGSVVLRYYNKGEHLCEQNEPGFTAFYILTAEDERCLSDDILVQGRLSAGGDDAPPVVSVSREAPAAVPLELVARARQALGGGGPAPAPKPAPGPVKFMYEGELLGEMSCLYRIPRTATLVAERDCYVLEMLRNVLDKMYADKEFRPHLDAIYRKRVLEMSLRALPLFRDLSGDLFERLREKVELRECEPGDLLCDENEQSDTIYLIRSGFVKVIKGASALLGAADVPDIKVFCAALQAGGKQPAGPRRKLWDLLPAAAREAAEKIAAGPDLSAEEKKEPPKEILYALNDLLKQAKFNTQLDLKGLPESAPWEEEMKKLKLPANPRKWAQHQQVRIANRRLLDRLYPGAVLPYRAGAPRTLAFRSVNEPWIGEIGVALDAPRSATCIAYDHSDEGKLIHGRTELVCIGRELFEKIRDASPTLAAEVRRIAKARNQQSQKQERIPAWHPASPATLSQRFDELGLIQGQKLMLIDLERCTRCDMCVQACVDTHTPSWLARLLPASWRNPTMDGRSRLFLDGPRYQVQQDDQVKEYLVPSTCRMCKDPVCLIGCPVGSIHKGDNGQIVIEDWCIGCTRCAQQCPYGSIQMHYIGILPRRASGWQHRRDETKPWKEGTAPFALDRSFREEYPGSRPVTFQKTFHLEAKIAKEHHNLQLILQTSAAAPEVWINGKTVKVFKMDGKGQGQEKWNFETLLPSPRYPTPGEAPALRVGHNVLTIRITPPETGDIALDAGLAAITRPDVPADVSTEISQEQVLKTAVVCDMCSEQAGQRPACVNACPHEAAMRIYVTTDDFTAKLR